MSVSIKVDVDDGGEGVCDTIMSVGGAIAGAINGLAAGVFFSPSHVGLCLDLKQDSDAHGVDQRLPSLAGLDSHQVRFVVWGILLLWIVFDSKFTNCNYHGTNTYLSMME